MKALFLILTLSLFSCNQKSENNKIEKHHNPEKKVIQKKEPNPSIVCGSDILSTVLTFLKYSDYENLIKITYIEKGSGSLTEKIIYYKNIDKFPRIGKDSYKLIKSTKINDSTYQLHYSFKDFYRKQSIKKILISYNN